MKKQLIKDNFNGLTDKEKMEMLDDIGFIGTQEKISPRYQEFLIKKTGEVFRKMREADKEPSDPIIPSNAQRRNYKRNK